MTYEVTIPEIGESVTEALILRWIKQPGEAIGRDDPLVELETDKVTVEMPCPVAGVLSEIVCAEGETVPIGAVIARIEEGAVAASAAAAQVAAPSTASASTEATAATGGAQGDLLASAEPSAPPAPPAPVPAPEPPPPAPVQTAEADAPAAAEERRILPAARRLIAEHGLDASRIPSTGKGGRLLKSDVTAWLAAREAEPKAPAEAEPEAAPPAPAQPVSPAVGPAPTVAPPAGDRAEERVPMTPIRRRIAERLVESQQQAALLTTFNEIDMSAVIDFRKRYRDTFVERHDVRLGFLSFFVKAAVDALRRFPRLNAEISGTDIIYRNYYDIGIAVSTDRGLMVPVLRSAERLSFAEIEARIADFAGRAREGRIRIDELQGGTFTITNGGIFGSLLSTPIINPPQSGVLGLHAIQDRPMVEGGEIVVRPMMYVALTYDHRIVDGREAVSFLVRIKEAIQDPARMLIEV
ncbi:MAG: 2-oxoglutarate dehydrogenase complex dihydrolipoyllysine-residue succinyltransferase [Acidobacteriota bacterium]|nr:2-oxoglutarate dehydrogenase complex dihydrolipoyllysine-residue succinyltransferase [Acidobacteriota bacterium]